MKTILLDTNNPVDCENLMIGRLITRVLNLQAENKGLEEKNQQLKNDLEAVKRIFGK